ncbi:MAG: ABC transporter substrate-binding protein [Actinomycetia bacterium]|nr:ABC transporter substrate-binding protein [Actinomycetes bacterium]
MTRITGRSRITAVGVLAAVALLGAACGGGDSDEASTDSDGSDGAAAGTPVAGGDLVYGLEAETSGGWCLPEAQLAISGIQVARTIYDTLTAPNEDDEYVPFLAESVEPNEDFTQWTIKLRDGITFHDGTPLTAEVVKNNLDAYRGQYEGRAPLLFVFVFEDIESVDVVDDLTLTVTTSVPWPALPASLYGNGRIGIVGQAQLDDPDTCDTNLIGTGPFMLEEWVVNDRLTATKNPDYWQTDDAGNQLPYLDRIEYRPFVEESARLNSLESGALQAMHTNDASSIDQIRAQAESGALGNVNTGMFEETSYVMLNASKPPFDNPTARKAVAAALDRDEMRSVLYLDVMEMASGPFAPGNLGYLEDTGYPQYDPEAAAELVAAYEQETGSPLEFTITSANSGTTVQIVSFIQEALDQVGVEVNVQPIEQAQLINTALGDDWQAIYWRNHPGGDPDTQYNWWYGGSPVNFGKFSDPEIDALLDQGRSESDPAVRKTIYEDLNKRFAEQVWNVWTNWSAWTIGTGDDVSGILGPQLPDGTSPFQGLGGGHPVSGIWITQ